MKHTSDVNKWSELQNARRIHDGYLENTSAQLEVGYREIIVIVAVSSVAAQGFLVIKGARLAAQPASGPEGCLIAGGHVLDIAVRSECQARTDRPIMVQIKPNTVV